MFWTDWHEQGFQEGMQLAIQQGMQREALGFVERLARRRLGTPVEALSERLSELSTQQLEELGEALLDFTSVSDLEKWLDNPARPS